MAIGQRGDCGDVGLKSAGKQQNAFTTEPLRNGVLQRCMTGATACDQSGSSRPNPFVLERADGGLENGRMATEPEVVVAGQIQQFCPFGQAGVLEQPGMFPRPPSAKVSTTGWWKSTHSFSLRVTPPQDGWPVCIR